VDCFYFSDLEAGALKVVGNIISLAGSSEFGPMTRWSCRLGEHKKPLQQLEVSLTEEIIIYQVKKYK
jgi:hypothetical protein